MLQIKAEQSYEFYIQHAKSSLKNLQLGEGLHKDGIHYKFDAEDGIRAPGAKMSFRQYQSQSTFLDFDSLNYWWVTTAKIK